MQDRRFIESFNAAIEGFIYVLKTERNMRVHFLIAFLLIILGVYLNFDSAQLLILCLTITFVLVAEMFNTAVELLVDVVKSEFHPMARIIKDVGAGAVLISSINAGIVGYMLFSKKLPFNLAQAMENVKRSPWHVTFIALIIVFGSSIMGKLVFHRGTPLRGGMPSGHSAIAFSIWTIIAFSTTDMIIVMLTFAMAFMIARHRITYAIHSFWEVFAGAILGILATTLVFQILR